MSTSTTLARRQARELDKREQAALRRLAAHMRAEAQELDGRWVSERLDAEAELPHWGDRVIPELAALMAAEDTPTIVAAPVFARNRTDASPLSDDEEACLRRTAALLRAEAAELGRESEVGRRFDGWGSRLALECEVPDRAPRIV